jgi:penicillin-binding protein activator
MKNEKSLTVRNFAFATTLTALSITIGCTPTQYVDSKGTNLVVSMNKVNIQDFEKASEALVASMVESGVLSQAPNQPVALSISRVTNDTSDQFDTDQLMKKIRISLLQTGKVQVTQAVGLGGKVEDPMAKETYEAKRFLAGESQTPVDLPYFTISAKILENSTSAGSTKQVSYIFQMSLANTTSGRLVWEGEKTITKQGEKNAIGF